MDFSFISFELAIGGVVVTIAVFFVRMSFQIGKIQDALNGAQQRDEKMLTALDTIADSLTHSLKDHEQAQQATVGIKVRLDKQLEVLQSMKDLLTSTTKDHEKIMENHKSSTDRILDRLPIAGKKNE